MRTIRVSVKPNARRPGLERGSEGVWMARVRAPPTDGRANRELVALVARAFGLRKAQVRIRSGASARMKLIEIDD